MDRLVDDLEPQSCWSCGGLLLSLGQRDCCCLAGLGDDERSLGTSSGLSITSVPGSSGLCDSEDGKCLPVTLPLSSPATETPYSKPASYHRCLGMFDFISMPRTLPHPKKQNKKHPTF